MTRRDDELMCDFLKNILWILVVIYISITWRMDAAKPTVVYIIMPQNYNQIEIPEPTLPDTQESAISTFKPRYGFTDDEIYLMATLLSGSKYVDGDGEYDIDFEKQYDQEQINLVLGVVMNRVQSEEFPDTVSEIIWAPGQFAPMTRWNNGLPEVSDISLNKVREWCEAYDTYDPDCQTIPDSHLYFYGNGIINKSRERWYN